MALPEALGARLDRVLTEQRERDRLREHGFSPMRKLLLVGPPGTGKTMTAAALAGELGLPLFSIQLDGLITKYMGETAAKLRLVFDAIQSTRGVYLFDEFDALGGERGSQERRRRDPPRAQLVPAVPRAGRLRQHRARRDEPRRSARPRPLPTLRCRARVRPADRRDRAA
jgi:SpoVK/Ycf46/Vps4 family AAA+-type ATPase